MASNFKEFENIIGINSFFQGNMKLKGNLYVDGKYEGEKIEVKALTVGPSGRVKTNVFAQSITVEGVVIGNLKADIRVILLPTARILGDIITPELIIQNGVVFEGRCKILNNQKTSAKELIEQLYIK